MSLYKLFARLKARQTWGGAWVQLFLNIGIITANIALFSEWFDQHGISTTSLLIVAPAVYVIGTIAIGYFDEQKGIWQHELEFSSNLNPVMRDIQDRLKSLQERL